MHGPFRFYPERLGRRQQVARPGGDLIRRRPRPCDRRLGGFNSLILVMPPNPAVIVLCDRFGARRTVLAQPEPDLGPLPTTVEGEVAISFVQFDGLTVVPMDSHPAWSPFSTERYIRAVASGLASNSSAWFGWSLDCHSIKHPATATPQVVDPKSTSSRRTG